jgi:hypothetical protein
MSTFPRALLAFQEQFPDDDAYCRRSGGCAGPRASLSAVHAPQGYRFAERHCHTAGSARLTVLEGAAARGRPAAPSLRRHRFEVRSHPQRRLLRVRTAQAGGDSSRAPHRGQRPSALHRDHALESRDLLESEGLPAAHQTTRQISW